RRGLRRVSRAPGAQDRATRLALRQGRGVGVAARAQQEERRKGRGLMAVVPRKRNGFTMYYVVFRWQGRQVWEKAGRDKRKAESLDRKRADEVKNKSYRPEADAQATPPTVLQYA